MSLNKEILKLAVPNILANLSVPLLSVVDVALMGHLKNEAFILAIGFGVMIFNFVYWSFGFLRMGMTGLTAQEVGKGDVDEAYRLLFRGLLIAISGAVLLILFKGYLLEFALSIINSNNMVNQEVAAYFNIRIYAAPATLGLYAFIGWFFGKQNSRIPMVITIAINLLNVVFSLYLVKQLNLETKGVAYGTVMAQYIGFTMALASFFIFYRKDLTPKAFHSIFDPTAIKRFVQVNSDIIIRTLCLIFTLSFFKVSSTKEGVIIAAANMILLEFITMAAYGIDGFAFAAESISGKYFGAKDVNNFKKAVKYCFYWGSALGLLYSLSYLLFGNQIIQLLTSQPEVIKEASRHLGWLVLFPILSVVAFVWDGVYIGVTASKAMRNTMLFATFFIFFPTYYITYPWLGNNALWLALIAFVIARGLSQTIIAKKVVYDRI